MALLGIAAAFFFTSKSPGWRWGGGGVPLMLGLLMVSLSAERILNRFKHKALEEHVL